MSKKKNNKYTFWSGMDHNGGTSGTQTASVLQIQAQCEQYYRNKYYNIWMSKFNWEGLDAEQAELQENFIMRKFWSEGTVSVRQIANTDLLAFTPYAAASYNMYDFPETVTLVNLRGVSERIIPSTLQVVNKDVVLGWCQPNHKPIYSMIKFFIDRLVQVEMVINTNLQLQKMPFLIGVNEADEDRMHDIVDRILNNEVVVFASLEDLQKLQAVVTATPYIIDKLKDYQRQLEKEVMTFLGIDNNGSNNLEQTHMTVDAINANNDEINSCNNSIVEEINKWLAAIKRVLGREIRITPRIQKVDTYHNDSTGGADNVVL